MTLQFNERFQKKVSKDFSLDKVLFCDAASYIINANIVVVKDCYYFEERAIDGYVKLFVDKTGTEAHYNKLFIDDLINKRLTPNEKFWCGLSVAKELAIKLKTLFEGSFSVYSSFDYKYSYVSFYKNRPGETLFGDIDNFKEDAVLIITT